MTQTPSELATLLDEKRTKLLDVVDWLHELDEEVFRRHVADEVNGKADDLIARALRHPKLSARWFHALGALRANVIAQLATVAPGDRPDYDDWRSRITWFRTHIDNRERELRALRAQLRGDTTRAQAANQERRTAHEEAVAQLIAAHDAEFLLLLVKAEQARGLELRDKTYRHLRDVVGRAQGETAAAPVEPVQ